MDQNLPVISEILAHKLRNTLKLTDDVAYENVTHDNDGASILDNEGNPREGLFPRGGPFGAALAISYGDTLEMVGHARGNNVVGSGIASKHAEDQALLPDNLEALTSRLKELKREGVTPIVWMVSSGQSCTTCHTKQEILARELVDQGLIEPRHFSTLYGATYDETFRIAQFYDAQYADALSLFAHDSKNEGNLIKSEAIDFADVPEDIQKILEAANGPTAIVARDNKPYSVGIDTRDECNPYSTAEVEAVRGACRRHRDDDNAFASWTIDGVLYTTSSQIGPLLFAEMGWTNITKIEHVIMPSELKARQFETYEAVGVDNNDFLVTVARGYNEPKAAINVYRDGFFDNRAQPMWARVLKTNGEMLYNGAAVSDVVLQERNQRTRYKFAALEFGCACRHDRELARPQPLAALEDFLGQQNG